MRKLTGRPGRQRGDETMQPPTGPAPWIARSVSTEFGRRHVKGVAITRLSLASVMGPGCFHEVGTTLGHE